MSEERSGGDEVGNVDKSSCDRLWTDVEEVVGCADHRAVDFIEDYFKGREDID